MLEQSYGDEYKFSPTVTVCDKVIPDGFGMASLLDAMVNRKRQNMLSMSDIDSP